MRVCLGAIRLLEAQKKTARNRVTPVQLVVEHRDGADVVATAIEDGVGGVTRVELS